MNIFKMINIFVIFFCVVCFVRKFLKAAEAVGTKVFKGGRFWTHSGGPQRSFRYVEHKGTGDI